ncbi:alcohol dehydrogenase catalytic domain-containing protein, partial [Vagococcus fluvialis]
MVKSLALGFNQYGTIDVFEEQVIDVNLSEKTDVLIKVERVSVNPVDISIRKGAMTKSNAPKNFRILGNEFQGEIVELKNLDTSFKLGDKVMAIVPSRADAEYVATSVERIFKVPETMPLDLAA